MAQQPDDEDEIDLGISLATVATIVDHARAVQAQEEDATEDEDEEDEPGAEPALALEDSDDLTEASLVEFIDELNEDEQAVLIALAWVGRGDYEPDEWEEALRLAAERNTGRDAGTYLVNMEMVGDLLSEGVAAFGLSLEEIDR